MDVKCLCLSLQVPARSSQRSHKVDTKSKHAAGQGLETALTRMVIVETWKTGVYIAALELLRGIHTIAAVLIGGRETPGSTVV